MDPSMVTDAVRTLRARGERVSVRAVHSLIGSGSFRDISRYLKDAREFLADDEFEGIEAEVLEPSAPPSLGKIVETFQASQLADHEAGLATAVLDAWRDRLRDLVAHPPPPAVEPDDVSASVQERFEHAAMVHQLQEEVDQLHRIVQAHQAKAQALRVERNKLARRAQELHDAILPSVRRTLAEAQHELEQRKMELTHAVALGERRVVRIEQSLIAYQAELQSLSGDRVR